VLLKGMIGLGLGVALLVGLGCGSSDSEPLTKAEFSQQGNKICKEATQARAKVIADVFEGLDPSRTYPKAQETAILKMVAVYEKTMEEIDDLDAPEGEEEKVESLLGAMEAAAERTKANPQTAVVGNVPYRKADKVAEELDLKECVI
jgi:hypothetical protein